MGAVTIPAGWRWFSHLFGVWVPLVAWASLSWKYGIDWFYGTVTVFVVIELLALTGWLHKLRRSPGSERGLAVLFGLGALFACACCILTLSYLAYRDGVWGLGMLELARVMSPFPCVLVYGVSSVMALKQARQLARRTPCTA